MKIIVPETEQSILDDIEQCLLTGVHMAIIGSGKFYGGYRMSLDFGEITCSMKGAAVIQRVVRYILVLIHSNYIIDIYH